MTTVSLGRNLHAHALKGLAIFAFTAIIALDPFPAMASHTVKENLKVEDLPAPAQATVREEISRGSTLGVVHAITEAKDGRTWFLARFRADGHQVEINFDPKGEVTSTERDVALSSLPPVVLASIRKQIAPDPKLSMAEADTEADGDVSYVVRSAGKALTFDSKGNVVETLSKMPFATLSPAIQTGIKGAIGSGELLHDGDAEAITANGATTYAVDVRTNGVRSKVYVNSEGQYVK